MKGIRNIVAVMLACLALLSAFTGCSATKELPAGEKETTTSSAKNEKTTEPSKEETTQPEDVGEVDYVTNNPIDRDFDDAIKNIRNSSRYEITEDFAQKWKSEMNANLEKLGEKLSPEHKELLDKAQKDWEDYVKSELKLAYAYADILEISGDDALEHNAKCYYNAYRDRAIQLYEYIQSLTKKYGDVPYFETEEEDGEEE